MKNYKIWDMSKQTNVEFKLYSSYDLYLQDVRDFINNHIDYIYDRFTYLKDSLGNKSSILTENNRDDCFLNYLVFDISGHYIKTERAGDKSTLRKGLYIIESISEPDKRKKLFIR